MAAYDAIVVGARCAGASLAMLLARRGRRVLALDRTHFPSDTVSTHFLWPRTTAALARWSLLDTLAATGCPTIDTVNMHAGSVAFRGRPEAVDDTAVMYCPRRTVLDKLLVDAAREAGADMREDAMVRDVIRDGDRIIGVRGDGFEERASVVVGADGMNSGIAGAVGAEMVRSHPSLTCGFYAYWSGVPTDGVEFYVRAGRDILVFPTHDGLTCIWVGRANDYWPIYRAYIEGQYLDGLDAGLLERVQRGRRETPFKGTHRLPNFYRNCAGAGWALVGDAAYHRDPLTGMGIGDAFLGAELLAEAIDRGLESDLDAALKVYQETLHEKTAAVFEYTLMSAALKDPEPQARLNRAIAADPDLTQRFMNVLGGSAPFRSLFNARTMGMALRQ
ncbi:MAG: NAD(P)/FAD-dependent oxidoreductase [Proteobacteria bacterium]|nr:NAD(P)/FAD-dependent oxidoreductase [Pseudomonadota bacterium]